MATPSHSPPSTSLSLPKKRPSLSLSNAGAPPTKRRKPSTASASSHPLRQTSFPPPDRGSPAASNAAGEVYSPGSLPDDYDDDDLMSAVGGPASSIVSGGGRGRGGRRGPGRPRGRPRGRGGTLSAASGETGRKGPTPGAEAAVQSDDDEDDGDGGGGDMLSGAAGRERLEQEKERRAMFLSALLALGEDGSLALPSAVKEEGDEDDAARKGERERKARKISEMAHVNAQRYELWNRIHLKKEVVRRLTNQTLSQSVPGSVVTAINAYTKVFAGEIIDRAFRVQEEWTAARLKAEGVDAGDEDEKGKPAGSGSGHVEVQERDLGPLLPDHLREALRRYKAGRDAGVVGFTGLSLEGRENTAVRNGGRRLFK